MNTQKYIFYLFYAILAVIMIGCANEPKIEPPLNQPPAATPLTETTLPPATFPSSSEILLENSLVLYTTKTQETRPVTAPAVISNNLSEPTPPPTTPEKELTIDFWALKTWPEIPALQNNPFSHFYGEIAQAEQINRYFLNFRPTISPNHEYLLLPGIGGYTHPQNQTAGTGLWLYNLHQQTVLPLLPQAKIATWNNQSNQIAYVEGESLYLLPILEGATPQAIFTHPALNGLHAVWSPDGQWLIVVTSEPNGAEVKNSYWLVPANGDPAEKLAERNNSSMEHTAGEISWSANSQFLLIYQELFTLDGQNLPLSTAGQLFWVPNQELLLVNGDDGLHLKTTADQTIAHFGSTFSSAWAFSADGQQLAYAQPDPSGQKTNIFLFNLTNQANHQIGSLPTPYLDVIRWGGDGRTLVMDDGQNNSPIWLLDSPNPNLVQELLPQGVLIDVVLWQK